VTVSDIYYTSDEFYNQLSSEQREEVVHLRENRDYRRNIAPVVADTLSTSSIPTTNSNNPALQRTNQRVLPPRDRAMHSARACVAALTHSNFTRTDLDLHADSPCLGSNAIIIYETLRTANMSAFINSVRRKSQVPIVHGSLAYDCPYTFVLLVHHALHFPEMDHNLIPPFQMRVNGVMINECPKFPSPRPTDETHSLYFPSDDISLPLSVIGSTSFLHTRKPTHYKYENKQQLELTGEAPEWNLHSVDFAAQEENMVDDYGLIRNNPHGRGDHTIAVMKRLETKISVAQAVFVDHQQSQTSHVINECSNTLDDDAFLDAMQ
jgi:hypothetical protein